MKTYAMTDAPVGLFGLEVVDPAQQRYWRLPQEETALVSGAVQNRAKSACGGRVRFRTDAKELILKMKLHTLSVDPCIAVCGSAGADVFEGVGPDSRYLGLINPRTYDNFEPEAVFHLDGTLRQITVNLPRNEQLAGLWITVEDGAQVLAPLPYQMPGQLCFYGSSITEGGCACRPGNAYTAAVSRWLDIDYVNYGFSGAAKGEPAMAELIARRSFRALVYDYDHNAPSAAHLKATHAPFFRTIRRAHPDLPVLILSRPDFKAGENECMERRAVIRATWESAVAAGDRNVFFLDGEDFFKGLGSELCTVDGCHPNDLGFYRMACSVYDALRAVL